MTDHQWLLIDHLGSLCGIIAFFSAILIWFAKWGKHIFKRWVQEAVKSAIQAEVAPLKEQMKDVYPWYQQVSKAFGGKSNGKAANA